MTVLNGGLEVETEDAILIYAPVGATLSYEGDSPFGYFYELIDGVINILPIAQEELRYEVYDTYQIRKLNETTFLMADTYMPEGLSAETTTETPAETVVEETVNTAVANASTVLVDGADTAFEAYTINENNYFKLRDIALILSGTEAQFEVTWDGDNQAINLVTGEAYTTVGGELETGDGTAKNYVANTSTIYLNGEEVSLTAYTINENNYFKLRDLGEALGFNVSWDSDAQTIIVASNEAYTAD